MVEDDRIALTSEYAEMCSRQAVKYVTVKLAGKMPTEGKRLKP